MKKLIKLMADYECYPLWEYDELGLIGNLNPEDLPISEELIKALDDWSKIFDTTLNMDDPIKSGFNSLEDELKFKALGEILARKLMQELKNKYEVVYDN